MAVSGPCQSAINQTWKNEGFESTLLGLCGHFMLGFCFELLCAA